MQKNQFDLMRIVQKIEVFRDLELSQVQKVLQISVLTSFEAGERIYTAGEFGRNMLILLAGKLAVTGHDGEALGEILPGTSTGEMGLFARCSRSATVTALEASTGLSIPRDDLFGLIDDDIRMHVRILQNLLMTVCGRLKAANVCIENHATQAHQMQERLQSLSESNGDEEDAAEA
jgi:CRP-like cAMP-binding protein